MKGSRREMRGARRRNRARRRLKSLRFILFNVGAALSFVPRINSNQRNPRLSPRQKHETPWRTRCKPAPSLSLTGPFLSRLVLITFHPLVYPFPRPCVPLCSRHFASRTKSRKREKKEEGGSFGEKKDCFFFSFHLKKKFVPITFIQMKNEVNCKTCAR